MNYIQNARDLIQDGHLLCSTILPIEMTPQRELGQVHEIHVRPTMPFRMHQLAILGASAESRVVDITCDEVSVWAGSGSVPSRLFEFAPKLKELWASLELGKFKWLTETEREKLRGIVSDLSIPSLYPGGPPLKIKLTTPFDGLALIGQAIRPMVL